MERENDKTKEGGGFRRCHCVGGLTGAMSGDRRQSMKDDGSVEVLTELENQVDALLAERRESRHSFRKLEERER